jgi:hypothetical protein
MELLHSEDKITFIVGTFSSFAFPRSGGSIAIHKLAYELANRGHFVYIFNDPLYPHENIRVIPTQAFHNDNGWNSNFVWEGFTYNPERTVSVYAQVTWGNPFNVKHVARWILHDYDPELWKTYGKNEFFFNYANFKLPPNIHSEPLTTLDYMLDKYVNYNDKSRKGFGHILHKFTPDWGIDFLKKIGSKEIPSYHGKENIDYLTEHFNKYEYILTFDYKTYLTTAACLCGAKSIILNPNPDISPMEYRYENPTQAYGIAYGMNDLSYANSTLHLVKSNILDLEKKDQKTIDNFIKFWEEKIKK